MDGRGLDIREWQPGDGDSRCQRCGRAYHPWFTDHWLWNSVIGGPGCEDDPGGYLCSVCFADRAAERYPNLVWRFHPEWSPRTNPAGEAPTNHTDPAINDCVDCGRPWKNRGGTAVASARGARGLCRPCYERHQRRGDLADYPRRTWPNAELLAEWDWLRSEGYTLTQAAERLGIKRARLEKAVERGRRAAAESVQEETA